jgi:hypothetical protein
LVTLALENFFHSFGLTDQIHETISGMEDALAETKHTGQALLDLSGILAQLETLTKTYTIPDLDITQSNNTGLNFKEYFHKVGELAKHCTGGLQPLKTKVRSLRASDNVVQKGLKRTRVFLENKELVKTRQVIEHDVSISFYFTQQSKSTATMLMGHLDLDFNKSTRNR